MNLVERAKATEKTLRKYRGKPFEWGRNDCITLARTQLLNMGKKPPRIPNYSSFNTAVRRLKAEGCDSVEDLLTRYCFEIAPAQMVVGDIATVKGDTDLSAIVICAGGKFMGYPSEYPSLQVVDLIPHRAWRV